MFSKLSYTINPQRQAQENNQIYYLLPPFFSVQRQGEEDRKVEMVRPFSYSQDFSPDLQFLRGHVIVQKVMKC